MGPANRFIRWLTERYRLIRVGMAKTEIRWLRGMDAVLAKLESQIDPMETLLRQSRKVSSIAISHPPELSSSLVERRFKRFVRRRVAKCLRGVWLSLLLLPLTALMTLFPGPNVFFGWNAFRLVSNYLAREAGKRILRGECTIELNPQATLASS